VFARVRGLAVAPLVGLLGACLTGLAPGIRTVEHHQGLTAQTANATCMGCHESEQDVAAAMAAMSAPEREQVMAQRMGGGGASLVAQWMLDDPRSCATCHTPRGGR
jgi:hypothetical protein